MYPCTYCITNLFITFSRVGQDGSTSSDQSPAYTTVSYDTLRHVLIETKNADDMHAGFVGMLISNRANGIRMYQSQG